MYVQVCVSVCVYALLSCMHICANEHTLSLVPFSNSRSGQDYFVSDQIYERLERCKFDLSTSALLSEECCCDSENKQNRSRLSFSLSNQVGIFTIDFTVQNTNTQLLLKNRKEEDAVSGQHTGCRKLTCCFRSMASQNVLFVITGLQLNTFSSADVIDFRTQLFIAESLNVVLRDVSVDHILGFLKALSLSDQIWK